MKKIVNISHRLKFIDSYRFMSASLSNHVDNLSNVLHNDKCVDCKSGLDYMIAKDDILIFRCCKCKMNYKIDFDKELINKFSSIYDFCKGDINKFILLLRKGVYPYEYMDSWNKFSETSLPDKKDFYSCLNMENITDIDYRHATRVFKEFKMNNLGDYHDLYVQSDTLLLADIFENFRNISLKTYGLDPACFMSLPGFAWYACLKITRVRLELISHINMLLMIESGMRGGVCHVIRSYAEANNKYMDNYDESKVSSFLQYLDANNLYGSPMTDKLPVGGFKWVKNVSKIDEEFIKKYDGNNNIGYFLKVDAECPKELHDLHSDLPSLLEKMKINGHSKLVCTLYDKKGYVAHIRNIKQAVNHGLKLKKVCKAIVFYQEAWLKPYIEMTTELKKKQKIILSKIFTN